jgi:hypothetical protein
MKRIVTAVSLVTFLMIGTSTASAGLTGLCNSLLGQNLGNAQRFIQGFEDCTDTIAVGVDFANAGCFDLLFAGDLFTTPVAQSAASIPVIEALCTTACACFPGVPEVQAACAGAGLPCQ